MFHWTEFDIFDSQQIFKIIHNQSIIHALAMCANPPEPRLQTMHGNSNFCPFNSSNHSSGPSVVSFLICFSKNWDGLVFVNVLSPVEAKALTESNSARPCSKPIRTASIEWGRNLENSGIMLWQNMSLTHFMIAMNSDCSLILQKQERLVSYATSHYFTIPPGPHTTSEWSMAKWSHNKYK